MWRDIWFKIIIKNFFEECKNIITLDFNHHYISCIIFKYDTITSPFV